MLMSGARVLKMYQLDPRLHPVTDTAVDQIGRAVRDGTPIEIDP